MPCPSLKTIIQDFQPYLGHPPSGASKGYCKRISIKPSFFIPGNSVGKTPKAEFLAKRALDKTAKIAKTAKNLLNILTDQTTFRERGKTREIEVEKVYNKESTPKRVARKLYE